MTSPARDPAATGLGPAAATAVTATCLLALTAYLGAVAAAGLWFFVLPTSLVAAAVALPAARRGNPGGGLLRALVVALALAELVNLVGGDDKGPVARSSLVAAALTATAVAAAGSTRPGLFVAPAGGIVLGALWLGAANEVHLVVAVMTVPAVVALALLDSERQRWSRQRRQGLAAVALALTAATVGAMTAAVQDAVEARPPVVLAADQLDQAIVAPRALTPARPAAAPALTEPSRRQSKEAAESPEMTLSTAAAATTGAALLGTLLLAFVLRAAHSSVAWWRLRRRLRRSGADSPVGAYRWVLARLDGYGMGVPKATAPEVVARGALPGLPDTVATPLAALASLVVVATFAPRSPDVEADGDTAWHRAAEICQAARDATPRRRRWGAVFRSPLGPLARPT